MSCMYLLLAYFSSCTSARILVALVLLIDQRQPAWQKHLLCYNVRYFFILRIIFDRIVGYSQVHKIYGVLLVLSRFNLFV